MAGDNAQIEWWDDSGYVETRPPQRLQRPEA